MRFNRKQYTIGERKIKNKFLFLPLSLNGHTRWLEFADIEYILTEDYEFVDGGAIPSEHWKPIRFM